MNATKNRLKDTQPQFASATPIIVTTVKWSNKPSLRFSSQSRWLLSWQWLARISSIEIARVHLSEHRFLWSGMRLVNLKKKNQDKPRMTVIVGTVF